MTPMERHIHGYVYAQHIDTKKQPPLYEYRCNCGDTIWLPKAPENIFSRSPISVITMDETENVPVEEDPKKVAQKAKQSKYRKDRYQMKKDGTWTGHMPKP